MLRHKAAGFIYQNAVRPLLFRLEAEWVHNGVTLFGEGLENLGLVDFLFSFQDPALAKKVLGLEFPNPVGLAAGFDYNGHLAKVAKQVGFGFNTVGTVTAQASEGNKPPRLARLPLSKSLLVNKGFRSDGAEAVARRLDDKDFRGHLVGISVGSSNLPSVNTTAKAIDDYLTTFTVFKDKPYTKYFELNISCPNTAITESFATPTNFKNLVWAVSSLKIKQPIFVKMPNEIDFSKSDALVKLALRYGIRGFIFSNLVKNRKNPAFDKGEMAWFKNWKGNFSGKPTAKNAKNLLAHTRKRFGREVALISVGGIFGPGDGWERLSLGADLVQLITGMIYEGPQLIGEINEYVADLYRRR